MIYHLLPEVEPFSEHDGGSLSRWAANVLRHDDAQIVCASADGSWGIARERIHLLRGLRVYGSFLKRREFRVRVSLRVPVVERLLRGFVDRLTKEDVLYIHNRPEYVLALQKRRSSRVDFKTVLHMHNDHLRNLSSAESNFLDPDLAVFNSRFLERQGKEIVHGFRETAVLYNGADEICFYPPVQPFRTEIPVVLFVGRLIPEKGAHVLLEAMDLLQRKGVKIKGKVVGSVNFGDDRSSAYVAALHRNAPTNVAFLPYTAGDALAEHFRSSTIFCCPSIWEEPFGMVNVEAMASGLPVVASRVGGIPEIFARGGGILVEKGSSVELAAALQRLAEDETERRHLAAQALAIFQNRFRWNAIRDDYRALMHRLETGAPYQPAQAS